MALRPLTLWTLTFTGLLGCSVEKPAAQTPQSPPPAVKTSQTSKAAPPAAKAEKTLPKAMKVTPPKVKTPTGHSAKSAAKWAGAVEWQSWDAGMAKAKTEQKPVCLVVYADWCPKCRSLAPILSNDSELAAMGKEVIMIKQNSDERPQWLSEKFQQYGGYVPRIFLLDANGEVKADLTSGHPRYPYFYTSGGTFGVDALKANLKKLLAG
ncbi:MAG: thioredoxin family protein [Bradymonadia bacterium]